MNLPKKSINAQSKIASRIKSKGQQNSSRVGPKKKLVIETEEDEEDIKVGDDEELKEEL